MITPNQQSTLRMTDQPPPRQTIAAKGFKFMTTTEIAFCAMRMYSHFRRTEVGAFR